MKSIRAARRLRLLAVWTALGTVAYGPHALGEPPTGPDAGTETVLVPLPATSAYPADLLQFSDGNLYSIAADQIITSTTGGTFAALIDTPQENPLGLVAGNNGSLYGFTANENNVNTVFYSYTPVTNTLSVITTLTNFEMTQSEQGDNTSQTVLGNDGNFYGTAEVGASGGNQNGAIFRISPSGAFAVLHTFSAFSSGGTNSDGANPIAAMVQGSDGNFYGTTLAGGANGTGTIFQMTPGGTLTTLHSFAAYTSTSSRINSDGADPESGLVQDANGTFYGTTFFGGATGVGTIYSITSSGTFTKLHDFGGTPTPALTLTASPASITAGQSAALSWSFTGAQDFHDGGYSVDPLVAGTDGNLYGVVGGDAIKGGGQYNGGLVFQVTPAGNYSVIYSFGAIANDALYPTSLIQGSDGNFYGDTVEGGTNNVGTIFKLVVAPTAATPPCTASGAWSGTQAASGSVSESPGVGSYTYTLACTAIDGTIVTQSATLQVTTAAAAPTVTIAVNPTSITLGHSAALTWSSTNAAACTASGAWSGTQAFSNSAGLSETPTATGTFTYTLTCTGAGNTSANASATLIVNAAPTVTIAVTPASITLGQSAALIWSSSNATACTASGAWSGAQARSNSTGLSEAPTATGAFTYTLTCTGAGSSSANASATLTVNAAPPPPPAPTVSIAINPGSITLGQGAALTWSSSNATACTASGAWSGTQALSNSAGLSETPTAIGTATYTLTCTGTGGSANASTTLTVNAAPPPPAAPTVSIAVNLANITLGQSAALTWSSANATTCTASGAWSGTQALSNSTGLSETPAATGTLTYTLACSGAGGSANASAMLTVNAATVGGGSSSSSGGSNNVTGSAGAFGPEVLSILGLLAALRRRMRAMQLTMGLTLRRATPLLGLAAIGLVLLPAPARAQQLGFDLQHAYIGMKAGEGIYGMDSNTLAAKLAADGDHVSNVSLAKHRVAGGLYGGVPIWAGFSFEAGLVDLGKYDASLNSSSNTGKVTNDLAHALRPAGQGLTLGVGGALPVFGDFYIEPHVAMLIYDSTQQANSAANTLKAHKAGVGGAFGLSAFYKLTANLNAGVGFDAYVQGGGNSVNLPSAQLEYRFGP